MIKITQEELLKYLYNETSKQKTSDIKAALQTNWDMRETFEKLLGAQQNLKEIVLSPEQKVVNRILKYASKGRHKFIP